MRGFQKGITLGCRTSRSALKVLGGWGGWVGCLIIVSLQSSLELELGVKSLDFGVGVWSWTGLRLDFRLTISRQKHWKIMILDHLSFLTAQGEPGSTSQPYHHIGKGLSFLY